MTELEKKIQAMAIEADYPGTIPYKELQPVTAAYAKELVIMLGCWNPITESMIQGGFPVDELVTIKRRVKVPGKRFKKKRSFTYRVTGIVPFGFICDKASVPRFGIRLTNGKARAQHDKSTVGFHDPGYRYNKLKITDTRAGDELRDNDLRKAIFDEGMYQIFLRHGVKSRIARLMRWAVRTGGKKPWRQHRERNKKLGYE